jgi:riboflavin kinase
MDKKINYFHLIILIYLLTLGAIEIHVEITSGQLSKIINKSQQTTSKILIELEKGNLIERIKNNKKFKIKVTNQGYEVIKELQSMIESALDNSKKRITFKGKIVNGMGEGAYYMSLDGYKKQFEEKLGYEPFPGTLNLKLEDKMYMDKKKEMINYPSIYINGFKDKTRSFGWVKCYPAILIPDIKTKDKKNFQIDSAVLLLERTHHDNSLMEVISSVCIKETANIKNGDTVTIKLKEFAQIS